MLSGHAHHCQRIQFGDDRLDWRPFVLRPRNVAVPGSGTPITRTLQSHSRGGSSVVGNVGEPALRRERSADDFPGNGNAPISAIFSSGVPTPKPQQR